MPLPDLWTPDPITAVYRRIRTGLLAYPGFVAAIDGNPKNFIDTTDENFRKLAEQGKPEDFPEVVMVQSARRMKPYGRNSMTAELHQSYDIQATVERLNGLDVNVVNWATFVGLYGLGPDLGLPGLVRDWNVTDAGDSAFGHEESKRGSLRYVSLLRISVELSVPRQLIASLLA